MATQDTAALLRLRDGLKRHFGPGAAVFTDPFLWLVGHVCVDVVRLDNWLVRRNPDYEENESMRLFIRRKYGRGAERFVEYWLKGETREDLGTEGREQERRRQETAEEAVSGTESRP